MRRVGVDRVGVGIGQWALWLLLGIQMVDCRRTRRAVVGGSTRRDRRGCSFRLAGGVAERLQRLGDGDVAVLETDGSAGNADLGEAGALRGLAGDERGTARGAAVLGVVVDEASGPRRRSGRCSACDSRRSRRHRRDVGLADVVAEDHQNVGLVGCRRVCASAPPPAATTISATAPKSLGIIQFLPRWTRPERPTPASACGS